MTTTYSWTVAQFDDYFEYEGKPNMAVFLRPWSI
jgi:hypothetical protein